MGHFSQGGPTRNQAASPSGNSRGYSCLPSERTECFLSLLANAYPDAHQPLPQRELLRVELPLERVGDVALGVGHEEAALQPLPHLEDMRSLVFEKKPTS